MKASESESVGLPAREFLYTLDQVAFMANLNEMTLKKSYVHFDGRSLGPRPPRQLLARNIAPAGEKPEWRIAENEVVRWLKGLGFSARTRRY